MGLGGVKEDKTHDASKERNESANHHPNENSFGD
jgi:hypothetical protein